MAGQAMAAKRHGNSRRRAQRKSFPMVTRNNKVETDLVSAWTIAGTRGLLEQQRQWRVRQNFLQMKLRTTHSVLEEAASTVKRYRTVP